MTINEQIVESAIAGLADGTAASLAGVLLAKATGGSHRKRRRFRKLVKSLGTNALSATDRRELAEALSEMAASDPGIAETLARSLGLQSTGTNTQTIIGGVSGMVIQAGHIGRIEQ